MPGVDTYWIGGAPAVAQISKATVGGTLAGETFQIMINGEVIAEHTDSTTVIADTVAALVAAFNLSDCPYADGIIAATDDSPDVVLTSEVDGMPFVVTLNTPGASATFVLTTPTASAGPNHWDTAKNWSANAVPAAGDFLTVDDPGARILWGLDQNAIEVARLNLSNFTMIGLRRDVFVTSADGSTWSADRPEYRNDWLDIGWTNADVGQQAGAGAPSIGRLKLRQHKTATQKLEVWNLGNASIDPDMPAMRYATSGLTAGSATHVTVRLAAGGIGFGVDDPNQECHMGDVRIMGNTTLVYAFSIDKDAGKLTWDEWVQEAGISRITVGDIITGDFNKIVANGGTMYLNLWDVLTQLDVNNGALVYDNSVIAVGTEITTVNLNRGGTLSMVGSRAAKTYATLNQEKGSTLVRNDKLTVTTWNLPADQDYTMVLS